MGSAAGFPPPPEGSIRDWLDSRSRGTPDRVSHIFPDHGSRLTWSELRSAARSIAAGLRDAGARKGDSIAYCLPNGRHAVLCLFGVLYGGFRATPLNLLAGSDALAYALAHSGARIALVGAASRDAFRAAASQLESTPTAISTGDRTDWPSDVDAHATPGFESSPVAPSDDALLMYTSGTTGRPKGVLHTQASLLAGGWTVAVAHRLGPADRALCVLPHFHINGLCVTLMGPLVSGGSVVVRERFSASRFWRDCEKHGVTWFSVVPTIVSRLVHGAEGPSPKAASGIRFGRSASSALAPNMLAAFEARFGFPMIETMGLTETAAQILANPLPPRARKPGSAGVAFGNEVAVLDAEDRPVATGIDGEIAVRGPNVMREYYRDPAATRDALAEDGWLKTGDLGHADAEGYVFVTGRRKELIIKGGENIAPREIDDALHGHADVVEAAAFARACPEYGERVEAAVRLRRASTVTEAELLRHCRAVVGAFKSPDRVHFVEEFPTGPSGKIQRLRLPALLP